MECFYTGEKIKNDKIISKKFVGLHFKLIAFYFTKEY